MNKSVSLNKSVSTDANTVMNAQVTRLGTDVAKGNASYLLANLAELDTEVCMYVCTCVYICVYVCVCVCVCSCRT